MLQSQTRRDDTTTEFVNPKFCCLSFTISNILMPTQVVNEWREKKLKKTIYITFCCNCQPAPASRGLLAILSSYTRSCQFSNKVTQLLLVDGILGHEFIYRKLMVNYCITRSQINQAEMSYNNMVNHCNCAPVFSSPLTPEGGRTPACPRYPR